MLQHCQHAKIGTRFLKRYILSFECAFWQAALGRRSYIKRQKEALPPPTVPTPLPPPPPTIIFDVFLYPFKGSRLNITALSKSDVTITEALSEACATCTVGPDTGPAYTDLRMDCLVTLFKREQAYHSRLESLFRRGARLLHWVVVTPPDTFFFSPFQTSPTVFITITRREGREGREGVGALPCTVPRLYILCCPPLLL